MTQALPTANLVLRVLALILVLVGVVIVLTSGWAQGLSAIVVGVALLIVDEATRRRRHGETARS
jgi:hypothetical protein